MCKWMSEYWDFYLKQLGLQTDRFFFILNVSYGDHKFPSESCSQHSNITNKKVANSRAKEIENQGCTEMNININD